MRIRWTLAAAADLEHIKNYLKEHNPDLAQPTVLKLYEAVSMLQVDPMRFGWRRPLGLRSGYASWSILSTDVSFR